MREGKSTKAAPAPGSFRSCSGRKEVLAKKEKPFEVPGCEDQAWISWEILRRGKLLGLTPCFRRGALKGRYLGDYGGLRG